MRNLGFFVSNGCNNVKTCTTLRQVHNMQLLPIQVHDWIMKLLCDDHSRLSWQRELHTLSCVNLG